jgi:hypothetical protein
MASQASGGGETTIQQRETGQDPDGEKHEHVDRQVDALGISEDRQ